MHTIRKYFSLLSRAFVVITLLTALSSCGYNTIISNEEAVNRSWGDLEAQLQRRSDLVPNLVETVKGYAAHEQDTLQAVIDARSKATSLTVSPEMLNDEQALERFRQAQQELTSSLSRLLVVAEQYPDLKANQNFQDLMNQLEGTENRISVARQRYNEHVETFNNSIRRFPGSLTNSVFLHLDQKEYFRADPSAVTAPKVEF